MEPRWEISRATSPIQIQATAWADARPYRLFTAPLDDRGSGHVSPRARIQRLIGTDWRLLEVRGLQEEEQHAGEQTEHVHHFLLAALQRR